MNFNTENIALFDQYLSNELEPKDRAKFEERLLKDKDFKREFETYQEFEESIRAAETAEIYDRVQAWDQPMAKTVSKIRKIRLWTTIAASAAVVLIVMSVFRNGASNEELVEEYFQPYGNIATVRGKKEVIDQGLAYYDQGNYQKSLEQFNQYPEDTLAIFYSGESYLASKKYEKAIQKFNTIIELNIDLSEVATFHKGIALLGLNKRTEARKVLSKIPVKSSYHKRAKELLEHL